MNNVFLHIHPVRVRQHAVKFAYTFCLGGLCFFLFLVLTVTGVYLMFLSCPAPPRRTPTSSRSRARSTFGLLDPQHPPVAAHLMVFFVILHMMRVFYHGAYKPPREFNWVVGDVLLFLTIMLSSSVYLLPWDQISYWAITIGTNFGSYFPIVNTPTRLDPARRPRGRPACTRRHVGHVVLAADRAVVAGRSTPGGIGRRRRDPGHVTARRVQAGAVSSSEARSSASSIASSAMTGDSSRASSSWVSVEAAGSAEQVELELVAGERPLERQERAPVERREAQAPDRLPVLERGVALVVLPAVAGVAGRQPLHHPVADDLGHDRRAGDRVDLGVAVDDRSSTARPAPRTRRSGCRRRGRARGRRPGRSPGASRGASRGRC